MMQSVANFSRLGANSRNVDQLMADTIKEMQNRRKAKPRQVQMKTETTLTEKERRPNLDLKIRKTPAHMAGVFHPMLCLRLAFLDASFTCSSAWYEERTSGPASQWLKPFSMAISFSSANSSGW